MVEIRDIREGEWYKSGVIAGKRVVLGDFAWGLKCLLEGAEQKIYAGCLFSMTEDGIVVQLDDEVVSVGRGEARAFVRKYR